MTETRRIELEEKLNLAEAKGDPKEIEAVKKTMEQEYRICTSHTAERLKRVEATVNEIKQGLIPADMFSKIQTDMKELKTIVYTVKGDIEKWKANAQGAKWLWEVLKVLAAAGGGGLILKLLQNAQI